MRIRIEPERLQVTPGVPASLAVTVFNTSEIIQAFSVRLAGLPVAVPLLASPAELGLFPSTEGTAAVTFTVPRDFPAGTHRARVEVTGTVSHAGSAPGKGGAGAVTGSVTAPLELVVEPVYDAALTLEPQSVTAGGRARFTVVAENRGNVELSMALAATDGEGKLRCQFAADVITVPPGRRVRAAMRAKGKRPFLGTPAARILTVRGTPTSGLAMPRSVPAPPAEALGTFIQKPLIPRALLTLLALLLALGLWGTVLFRGVNRAADQVAAQVDPKGGGGSAVIVGRVTDGNTGLGGVKIVAKGKQGAGETMSLTEDDVGAFALEDLAGPDTYLLTLTREGFATQTMPVEIDKGGKGVQAGLIAMARGRGSITGTVSSATGDPLGSVAVSLNRGGFTVARTVTETSGSVGFYSVGGLESAGPYLVTFEQAGFVSQSKEVAVVPDAPATLDAVLVPSATSSIAGLVTSAPVRVPACGAGQCPLPGVTVTVTSAAGNRTTMTASSPAGDAGRYGLADLPAGAYTVSFAKPGFAAQTVRVDLATGQPVAVNATLLGDPGALSGSAPGCTAVEARRRDLSELSPRRLAVPGDDGSFTLGDLPTPGEYRFVFRGPQPRTIDVNLGPGEQRALTASCSSAATPTGSSTTTSTATTTTTTTTTAPSSSTSMSPTTAPPATTSTTQPREGTPAGVEPVPLPASERAGASWGPLPEGLPLGLLALGRAVVRFGRRNGDRRRG